MSARVVRLAAVVAWSAVVSPWQALPAQPSTEGLVDVRALRRKFGIDIGGTAGPLSVIQETNSDQRRVEQLAVLSYLVRAHASFPVRAVVWLERSDRFREFGDGFSWVARERNSDRFGALGALVDMFDQPLGRGPFRSVRLVAALGGGVIPYAASQYECDGCRGLGSRNASRESGAGILVAGSAGVRWKRLAIDLHGFATRTSRTLSRSSAPMTMGVRF